MSVNYRKQTPNGTQHMDRDKARDLGTGTGQSTAGVLMSGERRTLKVMAGIPPKQKAALTDVNGYGAPSSDDSNGIVNAKPPATDNPDSDPLQRDFVARQGILARLSS